MTTTFMACCMVLVLVALSIFGKGYCYDMSNAGEMGSSFSRDLLQETEAGAFLALPRNFSNSKAQAQATRRRVTESPEILFRKFCGPIVTDVEANDTNFHSRLLRPLVTMLRGLRVSHLVDGAFAAQKTPLLRQLLESSWATPGDESMYDYMRDNLRILVRLGFFQELEEWNFSHPDSLGVFHHTRKIRANVRTSIAEYYYKRVLASPGTLPCPLIAGFPFSWYFTSNGKKISDIDVMAVPAVKREDGSFQIVEPRLNLTTLLGANKFLLLQNNWTISNRKITPRIELQKGRNKLTLYATTRLVKVPLDVYNCTTEYLADCRNYSSTPRNSLCTQWGAKCGVQTSIKLGNNSKNATHILYIIAKTSGGISEMHNRASDFKKSFQDLAESKIKASELSKNKLTEVMQSMENTESIFLPKLEPEQYSLTLWVIFLVFISQCISAASFLAQQMDKRMVKWVFCDGAPHEGQRKEAASYHKMKNKFMVSFLSLVPALVGFIPLLIGWHQAEKRKNAVVGILASGWGAKFYRAFRDSDLEDVAADRGASLSLSVEYQEFSIFDNLLLHYMITSCIATLLLLLLFCTLSVQGKALILSKRQKEGSGDYQKHQEDKPCASNGKCSVQSEKDSPA